MDSEVQKWSTRYPHLTTSIADVTRLVKMLREQPQAELEARFGMLDYNKRFNAGVSREDIDRVLGMMQSSSHVTGDVGWIEEQDFFYKGPGGDQYRTRVRYTSEDMRVHSDTIKKSALGNETLCVCVDGERSDRIIRVSLKTEEPVVRLQACVQTNFVRIKQRRRFATLDSLWGFDFAMLWSGASKTEAEEMQATTDPAFEIECELLDPGKALALYSDARIATSLLLKMCDLLAPTATGALLRVENAASPTTACSTAVRHER